MSVDRARVHPSPVQEQRMISPLSVLRGFAVMAALAAGLMSGGCAGAGASGRFQPEIVEPTQAVLYIYREPRVLGQRPVRVFVNQQPVGELRPGQYTAVVV